MFSLRKIIFQLFIALIIGFAVSFFAFLINRNISVVSHQQASIKNISIPSSNNDSLTIPKHINLFDFYKTYGQRLLGNENLKIINREEWGVNNNIYQTENCSLNNYDVENNFSPLEKIKAQILINNYQRNFQDYDAMFLQTKTLTNQVTYEYLPIEEIVIHHTAGKFTTDFEESKKELQRIYNLHLIRGYQDIGYHFLIDGAGRIYEGSLGGKYSVGAHTYYHNKGTIAIALMGDFRSGHDVFTPEMENSLINLIQYLIQEYHFDTSSKAFYLRKPDFSGREWSNNLIKGHQELDIVPNTPTSCPGINPQTLRNKIYPFIFK
ncbi:MAG: N-acetylmuramoyl-L-alanine amidase [Parcubacteria group bacterium]|nr:N-acetylmuramoyl-L-alanine amidase [Parcubacteria group bacterium]